MIVLQDSMQHKLFSRFYFFSESIMRFYAAQIILIIYFVSESIASFYAAQIILTFLFCQWEYFEVLCSTNCSHVWIYALPGCDLSWLETWEHTNWSERLLQSKFPVFDWRIVWQETNHISQVFSFVVLHFHKLCIYLEWVFFPITRSYTVFMQSGLRNLAYPFVLINLLHNILQLFWLIWITLPKTCLVADKQHDDPDNANMSNLIILAYWLVYLTHCRLNRLSHTIYWKTPISILGTSGYEIYIFLEKNG